MRKKLELEEDINFQKKEWIFQRIGLYFSIIVILLAIAGLFGNGLFTTSTASTGSFSVEYDRVIRREEIFNTTLILNDVSKFNDSLTIRINEEYGKDLRVEFILPEPLSYSAGSNGYFLTFALKDAVSPFKIYLHMVQNKASIRNCNIQVEGLGEVSFNQIILP